MRVPALSQIDNTGSGGDRCGETCLSACLSALDLRASVTEILAYLDKPWADGTSTIPDLVGAAHKFGAETTLLYSWPSCAAASATDPVILYLYNAVLSPRPYPQGRGWLGDHYVVLESVGGPDVSVMDPLAYPGSQQVTLTTESVIHACLSAPGPVWGIALHVPPPEHAKPSVERGPKLCRQRT